MRELIGFIVFTIAVVVLTTKGCSITVDGVRHSISWSTEEK